MLHSKEFNTTFFFIFNFASFQGKTSVVLERDILELRKSCDKMAEEVTKLTKGTGMKYYFCTDITWYDVGLRVVIVLLISFISSQVV